MRIIQFLKRKSHLSAIILMGLLILSTSCNQQSSTDTSQPENPDQTTATTTPTNSGDIESIIVKDFAEQVVIPTYESLVNNAQLLLTAVDSFVTNPNDDNLKTAQEAWKVARIPWEQSEAFAFGPASSLGYDGDLDDWPVNETDVQAVIKSSDQLTPEYVKNLQTTLKGFHTIEYLLFGVNNDKKAADFSPRDLELLKALTVAFNQSAQDLTKSWSEGVEGNAPYKEVFATAGATSNSIYPTVNAAVEEIVQGMLGCLDEVANAKIGEPLKTKDVLGFESRFSNTSLNDFKNNLHSVENAYLGKITDAPSTGKSLSDLVAAKNPDVDKQVKTEIQQAIQAVEAIPTPIEQKVNDSEAFAKMTAAQKAILTLFSTIEEKVLPIVKS